MVFLARMSLAPRNPNSQESVDQRLCRLAAARHGVFSRWEAIRAGATKSMIWRRVNAGRWERLHQGVYRLAGVPRSWPQMLMAACLGGGAGAVASHRSAAALWELAGVEPGEIEISVPRGRRISPRGVVVHEVLALPAADIALVDAIPATTPPRTVLDLAAVAPRDMVEEALDDALRRKLVSFRWLRWRLAQLRRSGRPGVTVLESLLRAREDGSVPESVLETRLLRILDRAGLAAPLCQYEVRDRRGKLVGRVDFAYVDVHLAIEVDGYQWHSGRQRWERDLERRNALTNRGWRIIHVTWSDLERRPDEVVRTITRALGLGADSS